MFRNLIYETQNGRAQVHGYCIAGTMAGRKSRY